MSSPEPFNPLEGFAEIERLVAKIYFRFSHLFLDQPELRDFWWEMAREEEQHGADGGPSAQFRDGHRDQAKRARLASGGNDAARLLPEDA